jgi:glutamine amidotransferase-like uncharacterized protein
LKDLYRIKTISAKELKLGLWLQDAALFIMPGGADIPYTSKLNGQGNQVIKKYISNGGKYLGICAGAYYASSLIEFSVGTKIEVIGSRELGLFPGKAIGPVFGNYCYADNSSAMVAKIKTFNSKIVNVYFNGGCYFKDAEQYEGVKVIWWYDNDLPAIISINDGSIILSGVHFEYDPTAMNPNDIYNKHLIEQMLLNDYDRHVMVKQILAMINL